MKVFRGSTLLPRPAFFIHFLQSPVATLTYPFTPEYGLAYSSPRYSRLEARSGDFPQAAQEWFSDGAAERLPAPASADRPPSLWTVKPSYSSPSLLLAIILR